MIGIAKTCQKSSPINPWTITIETTAPNQNFNIVLDGTTINITKRKYFEIS